MNKDIYYKLNGNYHKLLKRVADDRIRYILNHMTDNNVVIINLGHKILFNNLFNINNLFIKCCRGRDYYLQLNVMDIN